MRLFKQKGSSDCAVACLVMLTGMPYKKIIKLIGDAWHVDKGMSDIGKALERLGYVKEKKIPVKGLKGAWRCEAQDFMEVRRQYEISAQFFKDQLWGRRALLSVPSLNIPDGWHMIYWHYDKIYDPSPKKTYERFFDLKPEEIVIFMERPKHGQ